MGLKIKAVRLKPNGKAVSLEFEQSAAARGGSIVDSDNKIVVHKTPHSDLSFCFVKMVPHLMFLCELAKPQVLRPEWFEDFKFLDEEEFAGVNVTGIVVSGKDRDIIKILGTKTTSKKEVIAFNSPNIWLGEDGESKYILQDVLKTNFSKLMDEAEKFHTQGKYAPEAQAEMEFAN